MTAALRRWASLLLLAAAWEIVARSGAVPPVFLAPPTAIATRFVHEVAGGTLLFHVGNTLFRAGAGLALSLVVGIGLGLAMARRPAVGDFFGPLVSIGFPAPKIALFPLFVVLLGLGHLPKVAMVFLGAVFPVLVTTFHGATRVERNAIWSALSMGSTPRRVFWNVVLPASLPYIFSGTRIAVFVALLLAVVAEMVASGEGLGHLLVYSERMLETENVFVALVTIALIGLALDRAVLVARAFFLRWAEEVELTL